MFRNKLAYHKKLLLAQLMAHDSGAKGMFRNWRAFQFENIPWKPFI